MQVRSRLETMWRLLRHTLEDALDDRVPGLAAEVAFYVVLSAPPLLLVGLGLLSFVGDLAGPVVVDDITSRLLEWAGLVLTEDTVDSVVAPAVDRLLSRSRTDVLSIGVLITLWTASRASRVVIDAITIAYDLEEQHRSWWRRAGLALALTSGGVVVGAVVLPLLVLGPSAGALFQVDALETAWRVAWWPGVVTVGLAVLAWLYHVVAPWRTPWRRDIPGAVLAFLIWALGSLGLRVYVSSSLQNDSAYGVVAAPLALLLWIYVTALALLLGGELNAEIEKTWPLPGSPHWSHEFGAEHELPSTPAQDPKREPSRSEERDDSAASPSI